MKLQLAESSVRAHAEPNNSSAIVAELQRGEEIELSKLVEGSEEWIEISLTDQRIGYMPASTKVLNILSRAQILDKVFKALVPLLVVLWIIGIGWAPKAFMFDDWINPQPGSVEFPNPQTPGKEHCLVPGCNRSCDVSPSGKASFCKLHGTDLTLKLLFSVVGILSGNGSSEPFGHIMKIGLVACCVYYLRELLSGVVLLIHQGRTLPIPK